MAAPTSTQVNQTVGFDWGSLGFMAAGGALAVTALGGPVTAGMGALWGLGFGFTYSLIETTLECVCTLTPQIRNATRVVSAVVSFFATTAIAWAIANAAGLAISFGAALALSGVTLGISIAVALALAILCCYGSCAVTSSASAIRRD